MSWRLLGAFAAAPLAACGISATDLQPKHVPTNRGAVFGHVRVFKGEDEVTGACFVTFTGDENGTEEGRSLDASGWVFTTLPLGTRYLSVVNCAVWNGLTYGTRDLDFQVQGHGTTTYFGDVEFALADNDRAQTASAIMLGASSVPVVDIVGALVETTAVVGAATLEANAPEQTQTFSVKDNSEVALSEYTARYRSSPSMVKSLAGAGTEPLLPLSSKKTIHPAPELERKGSILSARIGVDGFTLTWLGLVRADKRWLGFRLSRPLQASDLRACADIELELDGTSVHLPLSYRVATTEGAPEAKEEILRVELQPQLLDSVAHAASATLDVCDVRVPLNGDARALAEKLSKAYFALTHEAPAAETAVDTAVGNKQAVEHMPVNDTQVAVPTIAPPAQGSP